LPAINKIYYLLLFATIVGGMTHFVTKNNICWFLVCPSLKNFMSHSLKHWAKSEDLSKQPLNLAWRKENISGSRVREDRTTSIPKVEKLCELKFGNCFCEACRHNKSKYTRICWHSTWDF